MKVMEEYDLTKEDWDSIIEVGQFEGQRDPVASIPSKVSAGPWFSLGKVCCWKIWAHQKTAVGWVNAQAVELQVNSLG